MRLHSFLLAAALLAAPASAALAVEHYVAPVGAVLTCTPTGSKECPWTSVDAAFSSKKVLGGDTVLLMDGKHAMATIKNQLFESQVTIQSENASNARIYAVHFDATTKNIRLRNLKIWRENSDTGTGYLVRSYEGSTYLTFENLEIRSREDSINYLGWSLDRWVSASTTGMDLRGSFAIVRNNTLTGVRGGIYAGPDSLVENNVVDGFAADGMKGVSRSIFRNNTVKNSFDIQDDAHRDGFQSYTPGTPISGLVLEGNTITQWTHPTSHALAGSLQGIGMFDGFYEDLLIQNNRIVTDHYHGISVYGARRARIVNNTVVNLAGVPGTAPHIKLAPHKDGTPSQDVLVANNLAMQFQGSDDPVNNILFLGNSAISDPAAVFEDITTFNYKPKASSGFIDTGDKASAPPIDILGAPRPSGAGPDRGAYEIGSTGGTTTTDGTTTGGTTTGGTTDGSTGGTTTGGTTTTDGGTTDGTTTDGTTTCTTTGNGAKFIKLNGKAPCPKK